MKAMFLILGCALTGYSGFFLGGGHYVTSGVFLVAGLTCIVVWVKKD